ncbi:MAG: flagellar export chaperone FlgN [Candidatus Cloacimonetes bacterium]|nr:flagellar export chaperone FlgN [Candidatus Cloacimonadota bacterium]
MDALRKDFFDAWEEEIAAYQEVSLVLSQQKHALMKWDITYFQETSQQAVILISQAHKATNTRNDLMETLLVMCDATTQSHSLKNISELFEEEEEQERAQVFFKVFANTLKTIDKLSSENKELIRTGLELVGDNLEMIADIIDHDRVYSRVGMIHQKRSSILLNKRI